MVRTTRTIILCLVIAYVVNLACVIITGIWIFRIYDILQNPNLTNALKTLWDSYPIWRLNAMLGISSLTIVAAACTSLIQLSKFAHSTQQE